MIDLTRRKFLRSAGLVLAAPMIVKASSLMKITPRVLSEEETMELMLKAMWEEARMRPLMLLYPVITPLRNYPPRAKQAKWVILNGGLRIEKTKLKELSL